MHKERLLEFDLLKGIGILLVVLGHTGLSGLPHIYIYSFHMPLFFFVSGYFYKEYPLKELLRKRFRTLILPWLFFVCLYSVTYILNEVINGYSISDALINYIGVLNPYDDKCWVLYRSIWFLVCLFEVSLLYNYLHKTLQHNVLRG